MARYFVAALIALPLLEIALLIRIGQSIGLLPTLALLIGAALAGGLLLRHQGLSVLAQLRGNLNAGRMPGRTIAEAMMIGMAALLLVLPGLLSDGVALALLLPPVRGWIYAALARRVTVVETAYYRDGGGGRADRHLGNDTIDLEEDDYRPR